MPSFNTQKETGMYAKADITKFLDEHPEIEPETKAIILERAEQAAIKHSGTNGFFGGCTVLEIFGGNSDLADLFEGEATTGQHIEIGVRAIQKSIEINPDNPILVGMTS